MEIIQHCCQSLKENGNVVDRRLGLSDILDRAIHGLSRCGDAEMDSPNFPKDLLVVTAVVATRSNRPVIIIEGLNLIFHLLVEGLLTKDIMLDHVPFFSSLSAMVVGKSAVWVIVEALCHVMGSETVESPLQMKAVSCVAAIVSDFRLNLAGTILISTLQSCFNLALTSAAPGVQARATQILRAAIRDRIVKPILEVSKKQNSNYSNSNNDNDDDDDYDSKKTSTNNNNNNNNHSKTTATATTAAALTEIFSATPMFMMMNGVKVHRPDQESFDPSEYLQDFTIPRAPRFLEFVEEDFNNNNNNKQMATSAVLRDVVQLLESFFRLASHPISPSVKTPDDVEIKTRQLALDCIISILSDFPDHSIDQENSIISPILLLCEDSLWSCIGVNIATTAPSSFFVSSIHLLTIIATQAHYALFPSFRKFFERVIFPLIKSRYSTLEQKIALLSVVRAVFSRPHLVVSYFCNYDCLAPLDHTIGFLQYIVHNVVEIAFLDYSNDSSDPSIGTNVWVVFSSMQQATLRCECLSLIGMLVEAMWRWLEEPVEVKQIVLPSSLTKQHDRTESCVVLNSNNNNNNSNNNIKKLNSWTPPSTPPSVVSPTTFGVIDVATVATTNINNVQQQEQGGSVGGIQMESSISALSPQDFLHHNNSSINSNSNNTNTHHHNNNNDADEDNDENEFGEPHFSSPNVFYHWKHLHHALMNRLIELEAKMQFDQNWKQGRKFVIQHKVIPADTPEHFAKWIRNTPGLKKSSIGAIFEKMMRDKTNEAIVSFYIGSFDYKNVHVDEALRKLLVSLMSDDSIPKFEGQVWEKLMGLFAEKYHEQNKDVADETMNLSQEDVDAMANAVFFLHSTEHNVAVKDKMTMKSFIRNAQDMVQGKKLPEKHWNEIYTRVCHRPWGPENPSQQVSEIDGTEDWKQNYWGRIPKKDAGADLWSGNMASHSEYFGSLRFAEQLQLRYIQRSSECFSSFVSSCGGNALQVRKATHQAAYCAPHYAIHVRLMMRMFYPVIAAACILGNKLCFTGPQVTLAQTLNHYVPPLLSIFGISTDEPSVKVAVARVFQQLLEQEHTCTTALAGHPGVILLSTTEFI